MLLAGFAAMVPSSFCAGIVIVPEPVEFPPPGVVGLCVESCLAIDEAGNVVSYVTDESQTTSYLYYWNNGVWTELGVEDQFGAMSANGLYVTASHPSDPPIGYVEALDDMTRQWLPDGFIPRDVNDAMQVVASTGLYDNGVITPTGPGESCALNNVGVIAGFHPGAGRAWLWRDDTVTSLPGSGITGINDINEYNMVAASIGPNAAILTEDGVTILPNLPGADSSRAISINNRGQVVGTSGGVAVIWQNGVVHNINDLIDAELDMTFVEAYSINDRGQMVGKWIGNASEDCLPGLILVLGCPADVNLDGQLNSTDIMIFLHAYIERDPFADFNRDLVINSRDVAAYLNAFTSGCE
jgi:uncharacterized membrane protein